MITTITISVLCSLVTIVFWLLCFPRILNSSIRGAQRFLMGTIGILLAVPGVIFLMRYLLLANGVDLNRYGRVSVRIFLLTVVSLLIYTVIKYRHYNPRVESGRGPR